MSFVTCAARRPSRPIEIVFGLDTYRFLAYEYPTSDSRKPRADQHASAAPPRGHRQHRRGDEMISLLPARGHCALARELPVRVLSYCMRERGGVSTDAVPAPVGALASDHHEMASRGMRLCRRLRQ